MLIDTGCFVYKMMSFWFIRKADLEHINISIKKLVKIGGKEEKINKIVKAEIDIDGHLQNVFFYIIWDHLEYDFILKKPWINHYNMRITPKISTLFIYSSRIKMMSNEGRKRKSLKFLKLFEIRAIAYQS